MGLFSGNHTCPLPKNENDLLIKGEPIVGSLTFQHVMLIISVACTGATAVLSLWLIWKHLHRYTEPKQQRQIIRIIFTPVVFAVFSSLSLLSYSASYYLTPVRDLYEAFALAALFLLFTEYVAPDVLTRSSYFANLENRKKKGGKFSRSKEFTVIPGGSLKWFHTKWVAIFGYVVVFTIMTIAEEVSQAIGTYCLNSLSPKFAHIWILIIENVAVTLAVTSVLQFFQRLIGHEEFDQHKPLLKLISFKLIVFVNFIQDITFSLLTGQDVIHGSKKITGKDLAIGIPALLVAVEQVAFAIFFHYSFRSREYHETSKTGATVTRMGTFRAAAHAFNPFDLLAGVGTAFTLLLSGVGPKDNSGKNSIPMSGGRGRGRGKYQQAPQSYEPLRDSYPPAYGQAQGANGLYQPQAQPGHMQYQPPYGSPPSQTQYLGAQDETTRYERSRSRSGGERELYQPPPPFDSERERLNPGGMGHVRSHSTDGGQDAASMKSMV